MGQVREAVGDLHNHLEMGQGVGVVGRWSAAELGMRLGGRLGGLVGEQRSENHLPASLSSLKNLNTAISCVFGLYSKLHTERSLLLSKHVFRG